MVTHRFRQWQRHVHKYFAEKEKRSGIALQYQQYDTRLQFQDDSTREQRTWIMVAEHLPREMAERLEYQSKEWEDFAPGYCSARSEWKP